MLEMIGVAVLVESAHNPGLKRPRDRVVFSRSDPREMPKRRREFLDKAEKE
jgi:hypothetical protein